ncbi:peroxidase-like [Neocloeon triangulifer]|uniref:peroxidase-like n=1 Tax=Neocloeon triangulifer TaxID=2078957 RepID=UPI00286ECAD4|nr:peroxidase-like [Neocloeon triangulifer]
MAPHHYFLTWALILASRSSVGQEFTSPALDGSLPVDCVLKVVRDAASSNDITSNGGESFCITASAVNEAFSLARSKVGIFSAPRKPRQRVEEDLLAEAIQETTRLLRDRYKLTEDEIWAGLPLLDTAETEIADWCPDRLSLSRSCPPELARYRSYDGSCNNEGPLSWAQGAAQQPFPRMLPPVYADGVGIPRRSVTGKPLPNARYVSSRVHRDLGLHDHAVTLMFLAWGQILDHDVTFTAEAKNAGTNTEPQCCDNPRANPNCATLTIPFDDPFYAKYGRRCIDFMRTPPALRPGCKLGTRAQNNDLTPAIDASFIYGSSAQVARSLRLGANGLMANLDLLPNGLKPLLPLKVQFPDDGCTRPSPDIFCFLAGDNRVNEQLMLTVLHTIFIREHNRIATELSALNPHWTDETLYQETRMIMAALVQHITFDEFLPILLGKEVMAKEQLQLEPEGYSNLYQPGLNPAVPDSFATAAFRFGHSLLPSTIERWSPAHRYISSIRLSAVLRQPFSVYRPGRMDELILGMVNQVSQAMDEAVTSEVTTHLFRKPGSPFGRDLASINIARAREHGVPSYTKFREYCGLPVPNTWEEFVQDMTVNVTAIEYSHMFESVHDVDLWSAGICERPLPGGMVGPTFSCIISRSFRQLRRADRFWYENPDHPGAFTPGQLKSIKRMTFARMLCDNSDNIQTVQNFVFLLPDSELNPRLPCQSQVIPRLDLTPWRDLNRSKK